MLHDEQLQNHMKAEMFPCPCCGYRTVSEEGGGTYDICPICFSEVDGVQLEDPNYEGGANVVSLRQAQRNFVEFGASERRFIKNVRSPSDIDVRDPHWKVI